MAAMVVAGVYFILPATIIVAAIPFGQVRCGILARTTARLYGVTPVVFALVVEALGAVG